MISDGIRPIMQARAGVDERNKMRQCERCDMRLCRDVGRILYKALQR